MSQEEFYQTVQLQEEYEMSKQPEALRLANALDIEFDRDAVISEYDIKGAAAKLRQLQGEVESMKAERLHTEKELRHLHEEITEWRHAAGVATIAMQNLQALNSELLEALIMVRDADKDCKRDGLQTIPLIPRIKIDSAIAKAEAA